MMKFNLIIKECYMFLIIIQFIFKESGNSEGKPDIVLHCGIGGSSTLYRRFFDHQIYRIIKFD